jgi:hypothetical protein
VSRSQIQYSLSRIICLVITHIFWAYAMKQQTRLFTSSTVCKAELYKDPCKASRELMGNHQLFVQFTAQVERLIRHATHNH